MNHLVPGFQLDDNGGGYSIPASSTFSRPKKSPLADEQVMELLWQNGQVVFQSQNHRSVRRSDGADDQPPAGKEIRPDEEIFIQEDEMNSWLHYPVDDDDAAASFSRDFYTTDLVSNTPADVAPPKAKFPPPSTMIRTTENTPPATAQRFQSFGHFSAPKGKVKESTVIESSPTPAKTAAAAAATETRASHITGNSGAPSFRYGSSSAGGGEDKETGTYDLTVTTSSPGGSGGSISPSVEPLHVPPAPPLPPAAGKRKGRGGDEKDYQSEDVDYESLGPKKKGRGSSTSTKRSRAAEVHNLSERRRRDRINEKMKALQELIPRCNKSDKASMLDEAIEYLKSLQMQVQMMSMGCSMVPMMFPGVQQYMPAMRMGMGMGMGLGMGMDRPMMQFPPLMPGSGFSPAAAAAAHLGQRLPMQAGFNVRPVQMPDPSRVQPPDPMMNSFGIQNPNQARMPNFPDPYQQFMGLQQAQQVPLPQPQVQNQVTMPPSSGPGDIKEARDEEKI